MPFTPNFGVVFKMGCSMTKPLSIRNQATEKTTRSRLVQVARLVARSCHVLYRKVCPSQKDWMRSQYQLMEASLWELLRGCAADLRTAFHRMRRRVDALPFLWSSPFGGSVVDPKGYLRPNTRTLGCMTDMQRLESDFPNATNFDWEMFRIGWEAGARWADDNSCKSGQEEKPCGTPDRNSIPDSPWGRV